MHKLDNWLTSSYLLASFTSLIIIYSISPDRFLTQAIWLLVGFGIYLYLSHQASAIYSSFAKIAYPLAIILLLSTFVLGQNVRGSMRWIPLFGFHLQTSELAKPLLVLAFARLLGSRGVLSMRKLASSLLLVLLPVFLILRQPDLGTSLVVGVIFVGQLLVSGAPKWLFAIGIALALTATYFAPSLLHSYQLARLESFIDPTSDPLGSGYNVIQSTIAIGSGGFLGKGLGHGTQSQLRFLPERHTDFVFASLVEELGMLGGLFVIVTLGLVFYRLASLLLLPLPGEQRLILVGIFCYLLFQTFVNIGMNLGVAPVTGVTLPLISYGGSSILAISIALGIAGSISAKSSSSQDLIEIK